MSGVGHQGGGPALTRPGAAATLDRTQLGGPVRWRPGQQVAIGGTLLGLVIGVNLLHGFAYACFFATVYIFVDENFPKDARTSAQSLFNILIFGLGAFLGNFLWGWLGDHYSDGKAIHYHQLFLVPMGFAIFAAVLLALFFHPKEKSKSAPELAGEPTAAPAH